MYAICRVEKVKATAVGAMQYHNDRLPGRHSNADIDPSRTGENVEFHTHGGYAEEVAARIGRFRTGGRAVRKDAVVLCEAIYTASPEWFASHTRAEAVEFFRACYEFEKAEFGEQNVVHFTVHMDETTPHAHAGAVPIRDGRLAWKAFFDGRAALSAFQDRFWEQVGSKFGMERGERDAGRTHKSLQAMRLEAQRVCDTEEARAARARVEAERESERARASAAAAGEAARREVSARASEAEAGRMAAKARGDAARAAQEAAEACARAGAARESERAAREAQEAAERARDKAASGVKEAVGRLRAVEAMYDAALDGEPGTYVTDEGRVMPNAGELIRQLREHHAARDEARAEREAAEAEAARARVVCDTLEARRASLVREVAGLESDARRLSEEAAGNEVVVLRGELSDAWARCDGLLGLLRALLDHLASWIAEMWPERATDDGQWRGARGDADGVMLALADREAWEAWDASCEAWDVPVMTPDEREGGGHDLGEWAR